MGIASALPLSLTGSLLISKITEPNFSIPPLYFLFLWSAYNTKVLWAAIFDRHIKYTYFFFVLVQIIYAFLWLYPLFFDTTLLSNTYLAWVFFLKLFLGISYPLGVIIEKKIAEVEGKAKISSFIVIGYRLGIFTASALYLFLEERGKAPIFFMLASLCFLLLGLAGFLSTYLYPLKTPNYVKKNFFLGAKDFLQNRLFKVVPLLCIMAKVPHNILSTFSIKLFLYHGWTKTHIALFCKTSSFLAVLLGSLLFIKKRTSPPRNNLQQALCLQLVGLIFLFLPDQSGTSLIIFNVFEHIAGVFFIATAMGVFWNKINPQFTAEQYIYFSTITPLIDALLLPLFLDLWQEGNILFFFAILLFWILALLFVITRQKEEIDEKQKNALYKNQNI